MAENDSQNTAHDETIIPVKPGLTRVEAVSTTTVKAGTRSRALVGVGLALTLIVAMVVVFWLPDWVANNEELADESLAEPVADKFTVKRSDRAGADALKLRKGWLGA